MLKVYMGWQMNGDATKGISDGLAYYLKKYGQPPAILEVSDQLQDVKLPEGMNLVVKSVRIPKNIILITREIQSETDTKSAAIEVVANT